MLQSEFEALKSGDQVRYTGESCGSWPDHGTVITRTNGRWLDDEMSVAFSWVNEGGSSQWHFFSADELELIKE